MQLYCKSPFRHSSPQGTPYSQQSTSGGIGPGLFLIVRLMTELALSQSRKAKSAFTGTKEEQGSRLCVIHAQSRVRSHARLSTAALELHATNDE